MAVAFFVIVGLIVVAVGGIIYIYNNLISLKNRVQNAWAQIDVQLKRRYDLIPNLVEVAKKYMEHERETLEAVIKARAQAIEVKGDNIDEKIKAENFLTQTLRSLFSVAERYPNLKADAQMRELSDELVSTENRIAFARQFYNDEVTIYNTKIQLFPWVIVANMFGFKPFQLFELEENIRDAQVKVEF